MKKTTILLSGTTLLTLFACGNDVADADLGKKFLEAKYEKLGCLELVSFNKTDGKKSESGAYEMWFSAEVKLKNGCYGFHKDNSEGFFDYPQKERSKHFEQGVKNMTSLGYKLLQDGEKVIITRKLNLNKTENGWNVINTGDNVYY